MSFKKDRKDRIAEIRFWAIPPKGTKEYAEVKAKLNKSCENPEIQKLVKTNHKKAVALIDVQEVNGLGLPADSMLREYNLDYNRRIMSGTLHDLPGSFNVVEAFNEFLPPTATFRLRKENDHIFCFSSYS